MRRSSTSSSGPHVSFEVDKIIGISEEGNYQVQWAPAWVSKYHLVGCEHLVEEFLQRQTAEKTLQCQRKTTHCNNNDEWNSNIINECSLTIQDEKVNSNNDCQSSSNMPDEPYHPSQKPTELEIQPGISDTLSDVPLNGSDILSSRNMECSSAFLDEQVPVEDFKPNSDRRSMENSHEEQIFSSDCDMHLEFSELNVKIEEELDKELDTLGTPHMFSPESSPQLKHEHENPGVLTGTQTAPDTAEDWSEHTLQDTIHEDTSSEGGNRVRRSNRQKDVSNIPTNLLSSSHTTSPYKCEVCRKEFPQRSLLVTHLRTHSQDKRFECTHCSKTFKNSSNLNQHLRFHNGAKPYACTQCDAKFTWATSLKQHQKTHSGLKPFQCKYCGRHFAQKSHLKSHTYTHTGEKPYKCSVCGKGFAQSNNIPKHRCQSSKT